MQHSLHPPKPGLNNVRNSTHCTVFTLIQKNDFHCCVYNKFVLKLTILDSMKDNNIRVIEGRDLLTLEYLILNH